MRTAARARAVLAEATAITLAQPAMSALTAVVVAALCAVVVLTTGRTVGSEQQVLASIDAAGTRTIVIRAEPDAAVDSSIITRLTGLHGVAWAGAFGPAVDMHNAQLPAGSNVAVRTLTTTDASVLGLSTPRAASSVAVSTSAADRLGLPDVAGALVSREGDVLPVTSRLSPPEFVTFLEPLALQVSDSPVEPVAVLVILAESPQLVAAVADGARSLLAADDAEAVSVSTSAELAQLRLLVQGQLGGYGRGLVLAVFVLLAAVVAVLMFGLVMIRRKDYGRRRALGATRSLIIALVVTTTSLTSAAGSILGTLVGIGGLVLSNDPLPPTDFVIAVAILATAASVLGSLPPAVAASRRDPLTELRVP